MLAGLQGGGGGGGGLRKILSRGEQAGEKTQDCTVLYLSFCCWSYQSFTLLILNVSSFCF